MNSTVRTASILLATGWLAVACASSSETLRATSPASSSTKTLGPDDQLESVKAFAEVPASLDEMAAVFFADTKTEREASEAMRVLLRARAMATDVTGDANHKAPGRQERWNKDATLKWARHRWPQRGLPNFPLGWRARKQNRRAAEYSPRVA